MMEYRFAIAIVFVTAACAEEKVVNANFETRDSAGVTIAYSSGPLWSLTESWSVDPVPVLDIGGATTVESAAEFGEVAGAVLRRDGGVLVADGSDGTVRHFDANGRVVAISGRKGEGPGEYQNLSGLYETGDSVIAWDSRLRRVSILDWDGGFVRSFLLNPFEGQPFYGRPRRFWTDGSLMAVRTTGVSSLMPIGAVRESLFVARTQPDGTHGTMLGTWPGRESIAVTTPQFVSSIDLPYGKVTTAIWDSAGFWVGDAEEPRIDLYYPSGALIRSVRWNAPAIPIDGSEFDEWKTRYTDMGDDVPAVFANAFREGVGHARFPDSRPPYLTLHASRDGYLWVRQVPGWSEADSTQTWDIFDRDGRWLGPLELPGRTTVYDISGDRILTRWRDADDVDHVVVRRIVGR